MNIWLINHNANPPSAPGDARHYSHARELMRRGHDVRIVSCSFLHLNGSFAAVPQGHVWQNTVCEGVPFTWIAARGYQGNSLDRVRNMFEFAWRVWRRDWATGLQAPDLVVGSTPHPFAALAAQRLAAHYRVPFVLEVRDVWPFALTEIGGHSARHPFVLLVDCTMRFLYRKAVRIVMFSRDSAHLLTNAGARTEKIAWIPHGVDLTMHPAPPSAPDDGVFTVAYLGAHNQWNSLDAVLDAAKILLQAHGGRIRFRFVGHGASKAALIDRARTEQITNVQFDDPVPKAQVGEVLRQADAFILNNRKDAVSRNWMSFNKLYEYLAAGRPVVFGSFSASDPVRESGAGISVPADSPSELAAAVAYLAQLPSAQLAGYGRRGREHIEQNYSIVRLVDVFEGMAFEVTGLQRPLDAMADVQPTLEQRA